MYLLIISYCKTEIFLTKNFQTRPKVTWFYIVGTQKIMNNLQLLTGQLESIIKSDEKVSISKLYYSNLKHFFVLIKKRDINIFFFHQGSAEQENCQLITGQLKKGRKRKFPGQDRKIRKLKCNNNQEYYSAKGKLVKPKEFSTYVCKCTRKCSEKLSAEKQK